MASKLDELMALADGYGVRCADYAKMPTREAYEDHITFRAALQDALKAVVEDAERYRWMRRRQVECAPHIAIAEHAAEKMDRAIDAARKP